MSERTVAIFRNNRSRAVRLPKEFGFSAKEVFIRRRGEDLILSVRPEDWSGLMECDAVSSGFLRSVA
jgi:virulence-associated protein VagC